MPKTTDKTFAVLIRDKFGVVEGNKIIADIDGINSAQDLANLLAKYKSEGRPAPIHVVWGAEY